MSRPRVKICCMQTPEEVQLGVAAGADAVGFVALGLSGPEVRDDTTIRTLAAHVPPGVDAWLLTREARPQELLEQVRTTRATTVQLCDLVPPELYALLRQSHPHLRLVQVIHVQGPEALDDALAAAAHADALVLDSGSPTGPDPVFGGTGRTHDWDLSSRIVQAVGCPVWLAGGLNAANVAEALATVQPFGVDLCSGVRTDHKLVADKLHAFMAAVRGA